MTEIKANSGRASSNSCSNWDLEIIIKFGFDDADVGAGEIAASVSGDGRRVNLHPWNINEWVFVLPLCITSRSYCHGHPRIM